MNNFEHSPDGYRGYFMIRQAESKFLYVKCTLVYGYKSNNE